MPHEREKLTRQIHKTALGAEESVDWEYAEDVFNVVRGLKTEGCEILALEQGERSVELGKFASDSRRQVLILGEEVGGICSELLAEADVVLEIPMAGEKESFNVSVAAGIAMWELVKK